MTELSYQLYSSRNFPPLADTLKMLARLGYTQVEGFGGVFGDSAGLAAALAENGLTMSSAHFGIDMLEGEPQKVLEIASATGMKAIYCPHLAADQRPTDATGWRAFGQRLQRAGEPFRAAGLVFGWHNHDFEFKPLSDGSMPLAAIFEGGPDLSWEADIAWIIRGGADPFEWLDRYATRLSAIHIKDIAPEGECADEDGWADVGHGTVDWPALWKHVRQNTSASLFVMEHDNPNDDERFARRSFQTVNGFEG